MKQIHFGNLFLFLCERGFQLIAVLFPVSSFSLKQFLTEHLIRLFADKTAQKTCFDGENPAEFPSQDEAQKDHGKCHQRIVC